jgi:hypothetical protein
MLVAATLRGQRGKHRESPNPTSRSQRVDGSPASMTKAVPGTAAQTSRAPIPTGPNRAYGRFTTSGVSAHLPSMRNAHPLNMVRSAAWLRVMSAPRSAPTRHAQWGQRTRRSVFSYSSAILPLAQQEDYDRCPEQAAGSPSLCNFWMQARDQSAPKTSLESDRTSRLLAPSIPSTDDHVHAIRERRAPRPG